MQLNTRAFSLTTLIIGTVPLFILFTWCAFNGFGTDIVRLFESLHPSGGFSIIDNAGVSTMRQVAGVVINTLYAACDSFISGFVFALLYNKFAGSTRGVEK